MTMLAEEYVCSHHYCYRMFLPSTIYPSLFITLHHFPSPFISIFHYPSLIIIHHQSSLIWTLFDIISSYLPFANIIFPHSSIHDFLIFLSHHLASENRLESTDQSSFSLFSLVMTSYLSLHNRAIGHPLSSFPLRGF